MTWQEPGLDDIPLLGEQLAPLRRWLRRREQDIVEISVNEPGRLWIQHATDGYEDHRAPEITIRWAEDLCRFLAHHNGLSFEADLPVLGCRMPEGHRFHCVLGRENVVSGIAMSLRVKRKLGREAADYGWEPEKNFSRHTGLSLGPAPRGGGHPAGTLEWFRSLVAEGHPVLVAGGTSTGKTTFVNNIILPEIPLDRRVITVEDSQELDPPHPNKVQLLVNRVEGRNRVTYSHLIDSVTRLNPDSVLVGEISVDNAAPCLRLLNTGHSSFVSTVHANDCLESLEAFRLNIQLAGRPAGGTVAFLARTLAGVLHLVHDGQKRSISAIERLSDLPWQDLVDETGQAGALARLAAQQPAARAAHHLPQLSQERTDG